MSDSLNLALWQKPPYPRGVRVIQFENEVFVEPTSSGWQMHNRPVNVARNAILITIVSFGLAGGGRWMAGMIAPSFSPRTLWLWTGLVAGWTLFCGVGGMVFQGRVAKGRPALLAVESRSRRIVESTNSAVVGSRLVSVVLRMGEKTDPENRSGLPIVQVAVVFERDGERCVEPLWTFDRPLIRRTSRSIEDRLRAVATAHGIEIVVVDGDPATTSNNAV